MRVWIGQPSSLRTMGAVPLFRTGLRVVDISGASLVVGNALQPR